MRGVLLTDKKVSSCVFGFGVRVYADSQIVRLGIPSMGPPALRVASLGLPWPLTSNCRNQDWPRTTTSSPIPYLVEAGYPTQRGISSCYTNRIEGQHTFPLDIQRALKGAYARDPDRVLAVNAWLWPIGIAEAGKQSAPRGHQCAALRFLSGKVVM